MLNSSGLVCRGVAALMTVVGLLGICTSGVGQEPTRPPSVEDRPRGRSGEPPSNFERAPNPTGQPQRPPRDEPPPTQQRPDGPRRPNSFNNPPPGFNPLNPPPGNPRMGPPGFNPPGGGMMPGMGMPPGMPGMSYPIDRGNLERDDPEMYALLKADDDLERETQDLAEKVRRATKDDRTEAKKKLEDVLNKHFEVRQERRQLQIKRMEEELKRLQEAVTKRTESRDSIVRKRIAELLGEQEELGF